MYVYTLLMCSYFWQEKKRVLKVNKRESKTPEESSVSAKKVSMYSVLQQ